VADFRLSERAERDLIEIYDYTEETFGAYQAEAYHAGLERTFDLLANFPLIGRAADEIVPGLRRFRFQAHTVFYTEEADFILIRAVLHQAREVRPDLFD
jgi:toxin ParE1/3/4